MDFDCAALGLAIEVDGACHASAEAQARDAKIRRVHNARARLRPTRSNAPNSWMEKFAMGERCIAAERVNSTLAKETCAANAPYLCY